jgi:glutamyl/glutaminyl-tRNA synthetase
MGASRRAPQVRSISQTCGWRFGVAVRAIRWSGFLVRVEDLDSSRVRPGIEEAQLSDLRALGLDWDGPMVRQSERMWLYKEAIERLDANGLLYPCYCTRAEIRPRHARRTASRPPIVTPAPDAI